MHEMKNDITNYLENYNKIKENSISNNTSINLTLNNITTLNDQQIITQIEEEKKNELCQKKII